MILYTTSDGERISEATIKARYSKALKEKHSGNSLGSYCECLGINCTGKAQGNDHTISRPKLKSLHKTELIYDPRCFVSSCNNCHNEFESYRSGLYLAHKNYDERILYLEINDPEGARIRNENTPLEI